MREIYHAIRDKDAIGYSRMLCGRSGCVTASSNGILSLVGRNGDEFQAVLATNMRQGANCDQCRRVSEAMKRRGDI